jgi:hypothetical protein
MKIRGADGNYIVIEETVTTQTPEAKAQNNNNKKEEVEEPYVEEIPTEQKNTPSQLSPLLTNDLAGEQVKRKAVEELDKKFAEAVTSLEKLEKRYEVAALTTGLFGAKEIHPELDKSLEISTKNADMAIEQAGDIEKKLQEDHSKEAQALFRHLAHNLAAKLNVFLVENYKEFPLGQCELVAKRFLLYTQGLNTKALEAEALKLNNQSPTFMEELVKKFTSNMSHPATASEKYLAQSLFTDFEKIGKELKPLVESQDTEVAQITYIQKVKDRTGSLSHEKKAILKHILLTALNEMKAHLKSVREEMKNDGKTAALNTVMTMSEILMKPMWDFFGPMSPLNQRALFTNVTKQYMLELQEKLPESVFKAYLKQEICNSLDSISKIYQKLDNSKDEPYAGRLEMEFDKKMSEKKEIKEKAQKLATTANAELKSASILELKSKVCAKTVDSLGDLIDSENQLFIDIGAWLVGLETDQLAVATKQLERTLKA